MFSFLRFQGGFVVKIKGGGGGGGGSSRRLDTHFCTGRGKKAKNNSFSLGPSYIWAIA